MAITMELYELKNICKEMAALGAATIIQNDTPSKDLVSQREAYRLFQEMRVRRWVEQGLVTPKRNGVAPNSKRFYSLTELQSLNNAESLRTIINRQ